MNDMRTYNALQARPIDPVRLAISTGQMRGGCGMAGMGGFLPPLPTDLIGNAIGGIVDNFKSILNNLFSGGNRDVHIPAQEKAGDTLIRIAGQVDSLANANRLTGEDLRVAVIGVRVAVADFTAFVNACVGEGRCHRERALRGLQEITALGNGMARDWENNIREYFPETPLPADTGGSTPPWIPGGGGGGGVNLTTLALIGAGVWFITK